MLIIGEKINSTRKSMGRAIAERDEDALREEAVKQTSAGAHVLDVNCGTVSSDQEPDTMKWLVKTVQSATSLPLCIDSPNPAALSAGLAEHQGRPMINSISGEKSRYEQVLPLAKHYKASLVALGMDDRGIPQNKEQAFEVGVKLIESLMLDGIQLSDIYFDPLVRSLATDTSAVVETLLLMDSLRHQFPGIHFVSGLSNVSYGLPERRHLNRAFVVLSIEAGLDSVIMDPLDANMMALIYAAEALLNKDRFCLSYIDAYQKGRLKSP